MGSKAKLAEKEIQKYKNLYEKVTKEGVDALKAKEKAEKSASAAEIEKTKILSKLDERNNEYDKLNEKADKLKAELKTFKNNHARAVATIKALKEELKSARAQLGTD